MIKRNCKTCIHFTTGDIIDGKTKKQIKNVKKCSAGERLRNFKACKIYHNKEAEGWKSFGVLMMIIGFIAICGKSVVGFLFILGILCFVKGIQVEASVRGKNGKTKKSS